MQHSEQLEALAKALTQAQAQIKGASKGAINPHLKSKYADLASVWDACRQALTANGLSVSQVPSLQGERVILETLLLHESGQWISGVYPVDPVKADPQGYGSALTYARRYSLAAMVGVAPDDDDDGHAASNPGSSPDRSPEPAEAKQPEPSGVPCNAIGCRERVPASIQAHCKKRNMPVLCIEHGKAWLEGKRDHVPPEVAAVYDGEATGE